MAAILVAIWKKPVEEDAPGTEPILHRENRVKLCCRLGLGERTHTHTHNHTHTHANTKDSEMSPEFIPNKSINGPLQAMNGCVGINDNTSGRCLDPHSIQLNLELTTPNRHLLIITFHWHKL